MPTAQKSLWIVYLRICGGHRLESLSRRAKRVGILSWWKRLGLNLWPCNIGLRPATDGVVAVRIVALLTGLGRRRGHCTRGRSVTSHWVLVNPTTKLWHRVGLRCRSWNHGTTGYRDWTWCWWGYWECWGWAWLMPNGGKWVAAGDSIGEVVKSGGGGGISRGLSKKAVFFSYICWVI